MTTADTPEDAGWRLTDHTASAAITHGGMWLKGTRLALTEAQEGGVELWGLWLGVLHFVHCLHHLHLCMKMATVNVPSEVAVDVQKHLDEFETAVPHLTTIRNVLEHYEDDYLLGKGDMQQKTVRRSERQIDSELSEAWRAVPDYVDGDSQRPYLRIADMTLDLASAHEAGRKLLSSVYCEVQRL